MRRRATELGTDHPVGLVILGVFLYSTSPVMVAGSSVTGPVFAFWRLWVGVAIFGAALLVRRVVVADVVVRRSWRWASWAGLAFGVHQLFYTSALKATSVADVALISRLSPLLVGLVAVRLFDERPGRGFISGAVVAMAGAALVVLSGSAGPEGNPVGMMLAVANVVAYTSFYVISKLSRAEIDVVRFFFGTFLVAGVIVSAFCTAGGEAVGSVTGGDLLLVAGVALVPGTLGHLASTWPLRWIPANLPPVLNLMQPVLAGLQAWWFLGQTVTPLTVAGGALTLVGVGLAAVSPSGRRLVAEARLKDDATQSH